MAALLFGVLPEIGDVGEAGELLAERFGARHAVLVGGMLALYMSSHALTLTVAEPRVPLLAAVLLRGVSGGISRVVPAGWTAGTGALAALLRRRGVPGEAVAHAISPASGTR